MFISNSFFDTYLKTLNGESIKLYLYRQYFGRSNDLQQLSNSLNISQEQLSSHIDHLTELSLWNSCFNDYLDELKDIEFPLFLYSGNCYLGIYTKEWLSLMEQNNFEDLINLTIHKYESTILYVDQLWNRHLSIEYVFLILYLGEQLEISKTVIQFLFSFRGIDVTIDELEALAITWTDFNLNDVPSIEYYYANIYYYIAIVRDIFSLSEYPKYNELSYIVNWCVHSQFSLELVAFACIYTKRCINQFVIAYTNKILSNWENADVVTIDDVIATKQIRRISKADQRSMQQQANIITAQVRLNNDEE